MQAGSVLRGARAVSAVSGDGVTFGYKVHIFILFIPGIWGTWSSLDFLA